MPGIPRKKSKAIPGIPTMPPTEPDATPGIPRGARGDRQEFPRRSPRKARETPRRPRNTPPETPRRPFGESPGIKGIVYYDNHEHPSARLTLTRLSCTSLPKDSLHGVKILDGFSKSAHL